MPALFASLPGHVGKVVRKGDKTRIIDRDRNQICLVKHINVESCIYYLSTAKYVVLGGFG